MPLTTGRASDFITFSRASQATVVDSNGAIKWAGHNLVLNSGAPATQTLTVEVGRTYTVECTGSGSVALSGAGTGTVTTGAPVVVTAETTSLVLTVSGSVTTMWAYRSGMGGMVLNPATGTTYYPTTGSIYNAPRLDYDPVTLAAKGLLVEEQRTNLLLRSNEFSNALWAKTSGVTVTGAADTAPDGTVSASRLDGFGTASGDRLTQSITITNSTTTASVWFKGEGTDIGKTVQFGIKRIGGTFVQNTVTHTLTNSWVRVSATMTQLGDNTGVQAIFVCPTVNAADKVLVWGAQLEVGSFATSYIPTLAASATRSADVASVATSAFPYDATKGSFIASFSLMGYGPNYRVVENGTSNRWMYGPTNATTFATYNGTTVVGGTIVSPVGRIAKAATAHDGTGHTLVADATVIASTTDTFGAGSSTMFLGSSSLGGASLNGWLRQITYIPRRLTNAELVTRSA